MARIRSIKPEFWTSEKVVECSRDARLLFIGLWTFCDDAGVHPDSVKRIKMEVYPGDFDIDAESIRGMLDELAANNLIQRYVVDGTRYLQVSGWAKHQRIDKPSYKYPQPVVEEPEPDPDPFDDHSANAHPRSGVERSGVEGNGEELSAANAAEGKTPQPDRVPVQQIVDLYHELLPELPKVQKITPTRRGYIQQRWREDLPNMDNWRNFFAHVSQSTFLMGKEPGTNGKPPFIADLEWLTKPANFAKIAEGKYHRRMRAV